MAEKTSKRVQNKKNIFFIRPLVIFIFIFASTGSACYGADSRCPDANWINPAPPPTIKANTERGIFLMISKRSSLNIDVERIVDYVQRELSMNGEDPMLDHSHPWVYLQWQF